MGMFPNTEEGRREAWKREYLSAHGGLQPGSDAAKALLRQSDAQAWVKQKMSETTKRGTPRLPDAVRQYATRLGKAGLDYRAIRIARSETTAMVADEQLAIAENSDICTGEMDFVMERGRDHWNCNCEHYAEQSPWRVDDPDRPEIPVHPNCMCEWRPRLKTDAEILASLREEMKEDLEAIQGTDEQKDMLERIDAAAEGGGFISGSDDGKTQSGYQVQVYETNDLDTIVPGFSKDIPVLESALDIERSRPATINETLNVVNPMFDPKNEIATNNCANSVIAYECQRNGYRVQALPNPNDAKDAYINNAFSAFNLKAGDIEQASKGRADLEQRLKSGQFPEGSRFIISQRWFKSSPTTPGHDYIAEKIGGEVRFIDGQKHLNDVSNFLDRVQKDRSGKYMLHFARIDDKSLREDLDLSRIITPMSNKLDNSKKKNIIYNEGIKMTKEEALEILKKSPQTQPVEEDDVTYYLHIGEFMGETDGAFSWVVYRYTSEDPIDLTFAFAYFVHKNTKEVSCASAPLEEAYLEDLQAGSQ